MQSDEDTPIGGGKVHANKGSMHAFLNADATRALGVDGGTELDVFDEGDHLRVVPREDSPARTVECVHCSKTVRANETADHHFEHHPEQRYDPVWYHPEEDQR
ncbi:hypothetical protein [Natrinema halophilum]|uniref:C2H2-type domain-containing protein n=1 Tax=Natrinema halophilum TaxID=1699371 RepID=A0A7D5H116_9EURY|nr:hypothetical protein [Natrinema halophilum]QLG47911.1 hypothetical protein HYG82_03145 [Natrinema halophilum]